MHSEFKYSTALGKKQPVSHMLIYWGSILIMLEKFLTWMQAGFLDVGCLCTNLRHSVVNIYIADTHLSLTLELMKREI